MKSSRHSLGGEEQRRTRRGAGSSPAASTKPLSKKVLRNKLRKLDRLIGQLQSHFMYHLARKQGRSNEFTRRVAALDMQRKATRLALKAYVQK